MRKLNLVHFESPRFKQKLRSAMAIVQHVLDSCEHPYVAFSTGIDSCVVSSLVTVLAPDVQHVWSDDELELPETVEFANRLRKAVGSQFVITLGWAEHAGWFRPWRDKPYWREPFGCAIRIEQDVDKWMAGLGYDLTFTGVRMSENKRRRDWLAQKGPLYEVRSGTGRRCCPIWDWTKDDVWALISGWNVPYNAAYDRMEEAGIPRRMQRVGPLPLAPRRHLEQAYPGLLSRLEERYQRTWND